MAAVPPYKWSTWLADVLRAAGIEVVEYPGWKTRGLGPHLPWNPYGVVWHHDASPKGDSPSVIDFIIKNFGTNGAHVWISRQGVWHILAAGRAAHTGKVKEGMPWNPDVMGFETDHTTGEEWPPALLESLRLGTAAIYVAQGWKAENLFFHKQISATGKVDPDGLVLADEKKEVARRMAEIQAGVKTPKVSLKALQRLAKQGPWSRQYRGPEWDQVKVVADALKKEACVDYRAWQTKLGYTGADADGIPGETSLKRLGKKHGFTVSA